MENPGNKNEGSRESTVRISERNNIEMTYFERKNFDTPNNTITLRAKSMKQRLTSKVVAGIAAGVTGDC